MVHVFWTFKLTSMTYYAEDGHYSNDNVLSKFWLSKGWLDTVWYFFTKKYINFSHKSKVISSSVSSNMFCRIILLFTLFYGSMFEMHDRSFNYDKRGNFEPSTTLFRRLTNSKVKRNDSKYDLYNKLLELGFFYNTLW